MMACGPARTKSLELLQRYLALVDDLLSVPVQLGLDALEKHIQRCLLSFRMCGILAGRCPPCASGTCLKIDTLGATKIVQGSRPLMVFVCLHSEKAALDRTLITLAFIPQASSALAGQLE